LKRAMRFPALSANDLISRAVSLMVSILFAWAGWGYWALVMGAIAQPLSQCIGAWSLCRWIPSFPRRTTGTSSMVRFAMHVYGSFTLSYFSRNMDNLLVGWRFKAQALGYYKKAYDLFALSAGQSVSPLGIIAVSALSRFNRDPRQFKRHLCSILSVLAFVGMGLSTDLTLVGKDMIRIVLGPKWGETGRIFTYFAPGVGMMFVYGAYTWVHQSIGRGDRLFRWVIVEFSVTGMLFLLGLPWGPIGIAVAWTSSFWILTIPALLYAGRPIDLGIAPVINSIWKYIAAALSSGCLAALISREIPSLLAMPGSLGAIERLATISCIFVVLYAGVVVLLHQGFAPLHQVLRLLREMTPIRNVSKPVLAEVLKVDDAPANS
jgi:PST family polysaccharide transporter